jgi:hypothetical protein
MTVGPGKTGYAVQQFSPGSIGKAKDNADVLD